MAHPACVEIHNVLRERISLPLVSWLSAAAALYGFDACIRALSPGAHRWSRRLYTAVALGLSGYFVRAGFTVMSDALGLALLLGAFHYGLRAVEGRRGRVAAVAKRVSRYQ